MEDKDDYTPMPDIRGFLLFMEKNRLFYVDEVRKWVNDYFNEKISLSKLTELLNEKFFNWHQLQSIAFPVTGEEVIGAVFVPCFEDHENCIGSFTSSDGQSFCYVREITLPVTGESEAIGERKFTLKEALEIWDACRLSIINNSSIEHDNVRDMEFVEFDYSVIKKDQQEYFKDKFGIEI